MGSHRFKDELVVEFGFLAKKIIMMDVYSTINSPLGGKLKFFFEDGLQRLKGTFYIKSLRIASRQSWWELKIRGKITGNTLKIEN